MLTLTKTVPAAERVPVAAAADTTLSADGRYLEGWMNRVVVAHVVNTPTEYSHADYVGTLAGVDRDANGSIQSILLTECTAGTTQRTFQDDNVIVWSSVMRLSLPCGSLLESHAALIAKVHSGDYLYR